MVRSIPELSPQMWAELLIVALCMLLFGYWLRRNVLAVLKNRPVREGARRVAQANGLQFLEIQQRLQTGPLESDAPGLARALSRDYRILCFLLRHSGGMEPVRLSFTDRLLMWDFRLVQLWLHIAGRLSERQARSALGEMTAILGQLAESWGQRPAAGHRRAARA